MQKIVIEGGRPLEGDVRISGAKNSALPILFASLLTDDPCRLSRVPVLKDIETTLKLLEIFGADVTRLPSKKNYEINAKRLRSVEAPYELVKTMRASVLSMGPLLARGHRAKVSMPGGCAIGTRPINLHLKAFEQMGVKIEMESGYILLEAKSLHGARIVFEGVTVTGTENVLMAAVLAKGESVLENAAREPEVVDLADFLVKMGARIEGAGTDTIRVQGVDRLHGCEHSIISDRIEAGTFMIAAAMTGGRVRLLDTQPGLVDALTLKLREAGAEVVQGEDSLTVKGPKSLTAVDASTAPYPGFATDFQAQFLAMMAVAHGRSVITENIFENRFMHALELNRMGADIKVEGKTSIVTGVKKLSGAPVMASDLRASAALILAGLVAEGITEVHRIYHLDRGYEAMEKKFRGLGAKIKRAKVRY